MVVLKHGIKFFYTPPIKRSLPPLAMNLSRLGIVLTNKLEGMLRYF